MIERRLKLGLVTLVLSLSFAAPVLAGPLEDGQAAYAGGDYATALRLLRPLAAHGRAEAQFFLGLMYMKGEGVPQDYAQAHKWFTLAASQPSAVQQVHDEAVKARDFVATKMTPSRPLWVPAASVAVLIFMVRRWWRSPNMVRWWWRSPNGLWLRAWLRTWKLWLRAWKPK